MNEYTPEGSKCVSDDWTLGYKQSIDGGIAHRLTFISCKSVSGRSLGLGSASVARPSSRYARSVLADSTVFVFLFYDSERRSE